MIAFTSDIDWAPEEVIYEFLDIFNKYNIPCTLFCTHNSKIIRKCEKSLFEIAVHPNFNELLKGNTKSSSKVILEEILNLYPESKGIRCHSMTQSTELLNEFYDLGMIYESNQFWPYNPLIRPYKHQSGLIRIPYNWEDDIHYDYKNSFNDPIINIKSPGFYIFDFHPIHVFLNTENSLRYKKAKKYYHEPSELKRFVNSSKVPGVKDLLIYLLDEIAINNLATFKMMEIAQSFLGEDKRPIGN